MKEEVIRAANKYAANRQNGELLEKLMQLIGEALGQGHQLEEIQEWISSK